MDKAYTDTKKITVLYVEINTGLTILIASSTNERKLEEKMYEWCKERDITPEYSHGDYKFYKTTGTGLGTVNGFFRFEEVEII